jgi:hypothetical protein
MLNAQARRHHTNERARAQARLDRRPVARALPQSARNEWQPVADAGKKKPLPRRTGVLPEFNLETTRSFVHAHVQDRRRSQARPHGPELPQPAA